MKKFLLTIAIAAATLGFVNNAAAQTALPSQSLYWDQDSFSLSEVNSYTYEISVDAGTFTALTGVVCTATSVPSIFVCSTRLSNVPGLSPGSHTTQLRTVLIVNGSRAESGLSELFSFQMRAVPSAPRNQRISDTAAN